MSKPIVNFAIDVSNIFLQLESSNNGRNDINLVVLNGTNTSFSTNWYFDHGQPVGTLNNNITEFSQNGQEYIPSTTTFQGQAEGEGTNMTFAFSNQIFTYIGTFATPSNKDAYMFLSANTGSTSAENAYNNILSSENKTYYSSTPIIQAAGTVNLQYWMTNNNPARAMLLIWDTSKNTAQGTPSGFN